MDNDGYFGERVAATYDDGLDAMSDPEVVAGLLAGMRLRDRWEGWTRAPFTSESGQHVSVWEKP